MGGIVKQAWQFHHHDIPSLPRLQCAGLETAREALASRLQRARLQSLHHHTTVSPADGEGGTAACVHMQREDGWLHRVCSPPLRPPGQPRESEVVHIERRGGPPGVPIHPSRLLAFDRCEVPALTGANSSLHQTTGKRRYSAPLATWKIWVLEIARHRSAARAVLATGPKGRRTFWASSTGLALLQPEHQGYAALRICPSHTHPLLTLFRRSGTRIASLLVLFGPSFDTVVHH